MISLTNISKTFSYKNEPVHALHNINLKIKNGEFIAIFGPSGSGKSTLLNLIGSLEKPTQGSIKVDKKDLSRLSEPELATYRNQKVGFVFQDFLLLNWLTVEENIALPGNLGNKTKKALKNFHQNSGDGTLSKKRADQNKTAISPLKTLLKAVDLEKCRHHKPPLISGGEKQRTAIARALFNQPEILLADEPTGNLDEKTGTKILKLFQKIHQEQKITIIIATHDPQIAAICDRLINLHQGKLC